MLQWKPTNPLAARALRLTKRVLKPLSGPIDKVLEKPRFRPGRELLPKSLAYSDISDSVSVNLAGRESTGRVSPARFDEVRDMVADKLLEFRDPETGEAQVEERVYFKTANVFDVSQVGIPCFVCGTLSSPTSTECDGCGGELETSP